MDATGRADGGAGPGAVHLQEKDFGGTTPGQAKAAQPGAAHLRPIEHQAIPGSEQAVQG